MHIGNLTARHARYRPNHLAVVFENHRLTYGDFEKRINRLANAMRHLGVKKGESIATFLPNCLELLEIYWAAAKCGIVVVPLSPMLLAPGLANLVADAEAKLFFTNAALHRIVEQAKNDTSDIADLCCVLVDGTAPDFLSYAQLTLDAGDSAPSDVELHSDDVCHIMYTSGTTGMPKGIVLTHQIRANYALLMASAFRFGPESIILQTGSIVFNGSFTTLLPCFFLGATYILHAQFDADKLIDTIEREKVTHIFLVPSQISAMLASPRFNAASMQSLQMVLSLGAPLHQEHKDDLNRHLPGRLYELYGLTEGFFTILDRNDAIRKQGSVGVPPAFSDMRIVRPNGELADANEVGEIIGRSPILMPGYFKRPDLTAAAIIDGWLYSGDLGYVDDEGYLYLVDRKKDMIDSGGVKVYPRDIEDILIRHPAIRDVAVFGVPHEKWGETPLATVVLKNNDAISAEQLKEWINARVSARFQRVHEVVIVADFPRNAAGKTLKRELRDPYWQGQDRKI